MPNRIIKESICTSEDLAKLSPMAEILFYRLIVNADDFGRFFANPSIVKNRCFQLKADDFTSEQIAAWLAELSEAGLIEIYLAEDGRQYLAFTNWAKHQSTRAKASKFPPPANACKQMKSDDCKRSQMSPYSYSLTKSSNEFVHDESAKADDPDEDDGFDAFWKAYPRKSGDIKQACFEYLGAIQDGVTLQTMLEAIAWQTEAKGERYMPSAEKWLRNKGWTEKQPERAGSESTGRNFKVSTDPNKFGAVSEYDYDFGGRL